MAPAPDERDAASGAHARHGLEELIAERREMALRVDSFLLLAKALRPPPDTHGGLADVQTRYRRRELDLIANEDVRELFIDRRGSSGLCARTWTTLGSWRSRRLCCSRSMGA